LIGPYDLTYNGVRVKVDQHIRIGDGERIYWYESGPERKFVINLVGAHLRDDGSGLFKQGH
jgi:hypothetical protein